MNMNINGRVREVKEQGVKTELRQHPTNGGIMWKPSIRSILAILALSSLVIGGIVKATVFYYQQQDTTKTADSLKVQVQVIKIDSTVFKFKMDDILLQILQKVDPENADETIRKINEKNAKLLEELKQDIKKANGK